jgi:hypothetical protein
LVAHVERNCDANLHHQSSRVEGLVADRGIEVGQALLQPALLRADGFAAPIGKALQDKRITAQTFRPGGPAS